MRARVKNGQWVLDDPTGLPDGFEVEIVTRPVARAATDVYFDDRLKDYAHALIVAALSSKWPSATRRAFGPKDEEDLVDGAKEIALHANRAYTTADDIKKAAPDVLRRFLAAEDDVRAVLETTPVP